jgi:hypothetical protein
MHPRWRSFADEAEKAALSLLNAHQSAKEAHVDRRSFESTFHLNSQGW